jgi:hypothetical protein
MMKKIVNTLTVIALLVAMGAVAVPPSYAREPMRPPQPVSYANATRLSAAHAPALQAADSNTVPFELLGFKEGTLRGPFDATSFFFGVPANWSLADGAQVQLHLTIYLGGILGVDATTIAPGVNFGGTLEVLFNDKSIATILLDTSGDSILTFNIPAEALVSPSLSKRNSLRLILNSGINCDFNQQTKVVVRTDSQFVLPHSVVAPPTDLSILPRPIFQNSFIPDAATLVVPDQPSAGELQAALTVAAGLGNITAGRLPVTMVPLAQLTDDLRANSHLIFVGGAAAFPALSAVALPAAVSGSIFNAGGSLPDDGIVQMAVSPWNPAHVVLVVGGNTEAGVVKAAQAVSSGQVRAGALPNLALVSAVQPKDIGVSPAVDRTLADLGYADTTSNAPGLTTEEFFFTMPQGQKAGADAYLNLLFTHSTLLEYDRSGVVIRLNSQPIGSIRFSDESALKGETRINLPATTVRPGLNRIAIDIDLVPRTVCVDPNLNRLWMRVDAGSSIHVPFAPTDASLQPLLDLTLYPSPFTLSPLFSGLAFVVAPNDPAGWRTAAKIAYDYGNRVGTGFNTLALAYGDAVSDDLKKSRDLIIIGRPSTLPIVSELGDSLPAPFEAGNDLAIEKNLQVAYHLLPGVNVGYVELLAAPWNSKRAVLLVAGSTETGLDWAGTVLTTPALRSQLSGNFAAINGTQVVSSDTRIGGLQSALATAVPGNVVPVAIGQPPTVERPVWVLPVLALTVLLMMAVIVYVAVSALRRQRPRR